MLPKSQKVFFGARSLIHKNYYMTPALILLLQEKYVTEKRRFTDTFLQSTDMFVRFTDVFLHYRDITRLICWHRDFSACESKEHKNEYEFWKTFLTYLLYSIKYNDAKWKWWFILRKEPEYCAWVCYHHYCHEIQSKISTFHVTIILCKLVITISTPL